MFILKVTPSVALALLLCACDKNDGTPLLPATNSTDASAPYLDHAQPKLATMKLWIGAQEMIAELALTHTQVSTGMMYRKQMGDNEGMFFVFGRPHRASFYMRNTLIPLSAAYIDSEGTILEIHDLKPLDETPVEASSDKVQYVLETRQGWFKRNNIGVGTVIRTERGSLHDTFIRNREP